MFYVTYGASLDDASLSALCCSVDTAEDNRSFIDSAVSLAKGQLVYLLH